MKIREKASKHVGIETARALQIGSVASVAVGRYAGMVLMMVMMLMMVRRRCQIRSE